MLSSNSVFQSAFVPGWTSNESTAFANTRTLAAINIETLLTLKNQKTPSELFDFFLKDFEQGPERKVTPSKQNSLTEEVKIKVPENLKIFDPYIVFIIFVYLKNFEYNGQEEKVAWTIPINYKGVRLYLSHRKFGFRIITNLQDEETQNKVVEAMTNIHKAIPFAESLFQPFVEGQVKLGNITLENEYNSIYSRYVFFKRKAKQEFRKAESFKCKMTTGRKHDAETEKLLSKIIAIQNTSLKHNEAGNNYATAMLDSYFCLLEHTFVLLLPFLDHVQIEDINLDEFIRSNWKDKLKKVIPLTGNTVPQQLYEKLSKIKEELRNPLTHGYFLKDGSSFYVHTPNLGAIPMALTKKKDRLSYGFYPIHHINFEEICKLFESFEKFLKTQKSTKFGIYYIKSGLSIAFDTDSSNKYRRAKKTIKYFNDFILGEMIQQNNANNMDW